MNQWRLVDYTFQLTGYATGQMKNIYLLFYATTHAINNIYKLISFQN